VPSTLMLAVDWARRTVPRKRPWEWPLEWPWEWPWGWACCRWLTMEDPRPLEWPECPVGLELLGRTMELLCPECLECWECPEWPRRKGWFTLTAVHSDHGETGWLLHGLVLPLLPQDWVLPWLPQDRVLPQGAAWP
jgi:hypothetical protein